MILITFFAVVIAATIGFVGGSFVDPVLPASLFTRRKRVVVYFSLAANLYPVKQSLAGPYVDHPNGIILLLPGGQCAGQEHVKGWHPDSGWTTEEMNDFRRQQADCVKQPSKVMLENGVHPDRGWTTEDEFRRQQNGDA